MFHFHLSLVVWSVQSEALHSRRHSDELSEPAAYYLSQWQMTNCKMENACGCATMPAAFRRQDPKRSRHSYFVEN